MFVILTAVLWSSVSAQARYCSQTVAKLPGWARLFCVVKHPLISKNDEAKVQEVNDGVLVNLMLTPALLVG